MRITFCGHASFLGSEKIEEQLLSLFDKVIGQEYVEFYLGGYGGFDEFCYSCCKKYKKTHPKAQLIFITPYITEQYQKKSFLLRANGMMKLYIPKSRINRCVSRFYTVTNGWWKRRILLFLILSMILAVHTKHIVMQNERER